MKNWIAGIALAVALASPALSRNLAIPPSNPTVTIVVPDKWKVSEIEYGYSAKSPDGDVFFSVEHGKGKKFDALVKANDEWMAENEIDGSVKPEEKEMDFNGTKGQVLRYNTKDPNGKTILDFVLLDGGNKTVIMLTLWGSKEEREANAEDIGAIMNSVRPIR